MKWSQIPQSVRDTIWSSGCLPSDWDYELPISQVDVVPLYSALSIDGEFDSCGVYADEVMDSYNRSDLDYPIIIDRRLKGGQANVADGLHRVMLAYQLGVNTLPAIDVTDMFIQLGMPEARNDYK